MYSQSTVTPISQGNQARLNNFKSLKIEVTPEINTAWLYFNSSPRPCFTMELLDELNDFQNIIRASNGTLTWEGEEVEIHYCVISSTEDKVFSFGGDLNHFVKCIETKDRDSLSMYAKKAIDAVYYNHIGRECGLTTISMIHGNALGGGFEAALSSNILVCDKNASMGLPEVIFNMFPGMGAYNFIAERTNAATARKMIVSGRMYSADELYEKGIVDVLAEPGESRSAVIAYIRSCRKNFSRINYNAIQQVSEIVNPIDYDKLIEIGELWVDTAMQISEKDMRTMKRLVSNQNRQMQKTADEREFDNRVNNAYT